MNDTEKIKIIVTNRKATFEYEILDKFEAGIVLVGTEVKALREGKANLQDAFARIINGEAWLLNCHISEYKFGNINNHEPLRNRKLLLNKKEIRKIRVELEQKGLTLIPLKLYFKNSNYEFVVRMVDWKSILNNKQTKEKVERVTVTEGA